MPIGKFLIDNEIPFLVAEFFGTLQYKKANSQIRGLLTFSFNKSSEKNLLIINNINESIFSLYKPIKFTKIEPNEIGFPIKVSYT